VCECECEPLHAAGERPAAFVHHAQEVHLHCRDAASVGRIGRQLAGQGFSWQDRAAVGRIGRQLAGQGDSWQDRTAVGKIGRQLGVHHSEAFSHALGESRAAQVLQPS